jgi:hypothetical protein
MDIAYLLGGGLFWLVTVLTVIGLQQLEKTKGGQS